MNIGHSATHAPISARDIDAELLFAAYERKEKNALMNYGTALTIALLFSRLFERDLITVWAVSILAATMVMSADVWWFKRKISTAQGLRSWVVYQRWRMRFRLHSALTGLAWSVGPTLMITYSSGTGLTVCLLVLIAVCSVAMNTLAEQQSAMQHFLVAALLPPAIAAAVIAGPVEILLAVTLIVGLAQFMVVGQDSFRTMRDRLEARQRLRNILDSAPDAIIELDTEGIVTDWNLSAETIFGRTKSEALGKRFVEFNLPESSRRLNEERLAEFTRNPDDQTSEKFETEMVRSNGEIFVAEIIVTSRRVRGQRYLNGFVVDITQRKLAERRLALFRRVFDSSTQSIGIANGRGIVLYQNRAMRESLGYPDDEIIGKDIVMVLDAANAEQLSQSVVGALTTSGKWTGEIPLKRKDGSQFISYSSIGFVTDEAQRVKYVFNIFTDFTEELNRRNELATAKELAEGANKAKSEFLASMSHELRTPMNAILGFAQILEYDDSLSADQKDSVTEILKGGRHLLELITEVLDLAKIESGRVQLSIEPIDLTQLINECIQLVTPLANTRAIKFSVELAKQNAVRADRTRLKQILLNLLSNAIKYNRQGGAIHVSNRKSKERAAERVLIADTGLGISAANIGGLFEAFNRLGAENSAVEGSGVGLTITKQLVELMGGSIGVDSIEGSGSTFWVDLPAASLDSPTRLPPRVAAKQPSELALCRRVLCIDDNRVNLKLIAHMLSQRPHLDVLTAPSPQLGIELALAQVPDLIMLDINMPDYDGYQVLQILKADAVLKDIPVFAITANAMPRDIERGLAAGFSRYLIKPLDVAMLLQTVDEVFGPTVTQAPAEVQ